MVIQLRARHYDLMGAIFYAKVYANFDNYVLKKTKLETFALYF